MFIKLSLLIYLLFLCSTVFCQDSMVTRKIELEVLLKNQVGKVHYFNLSKKKKEKNLIQLRYLGKIQTRSKILYKLLCWARIWGANNHSTGVILLYDNYNKFVGKYVLGNMFDLPIKIEDNSLVFYNKSRTHCDKKIISRVSFDSIPNKIFIKCNGNLGDLYSYIEAE